jgi:hypothetical protein
MRNFLRVAAGVNPMPLLMQLYAQANIWGGDDIRQSYSEQSPHVEVQDVLLRFSDTEDPNIGDILQCEWTEQARILPAVKDIVFPLMATVRGEQIGRVMITRLAPGKRIYPHADLIGKYAHFYTRFHIPLVSDPGVLFNCGEESVNMLPGEVWWFNGHLVHEVINNSTQDRLNLIVDVRT